MEGLDFSRIDALTTLSRSGFVQPRLCRATQDMVKVAQHR